MTRVDGELKEKQCWKEAAVFFGPPPQSSVGWRGPQHGCKAMGGPQPPGAAQALVTSAAFQGTPSSDL